MNPQHKEGKNIVVIGAGLAGISVAIRLSVAGHKVRIYETNQNAGGKIHEWRNEGFRFDMGPSVFTMPNYLEDLFRIAGKRPEDYIKIVKPELPFNYFLPSGKEINFFSDREKLIHELVTKTSDSEKSIIKYLDNIKAKYDLTSSVFLQRSLHVISNYFSKDAIKGLLNFGKIEALISMDDCNRNIFKDEDTIRIFNSFASYVGSNPYKAPAVFNVISHVQMGGVYLPVGGIKSIINSLMKLCDDLGIEINLGSKVSSIVIEKGKAVGIQVEEERISSDMVVSAMDVYNTYKQLMPSVKSPKKILEQPKSQSFLVFMWGMKKTFPRLTLHNMFVTENMEQEYDNLLCNGDIGDDFSIYIYVSSKLNREDAPEGCENWYILVNAPHLNGQDWDAMRVRVREKIIEKLSSYFGEDISRHIGFEKIRDPRDHQAQTNTAFGAIYGNSFNGKFSVFLRHPNFSSRIKNLYFCGGTVHPGGGMPLSILSSKIVADLISRKKS